MVIRRREWKVSRIKKFCIAVIYFLGIFVIAYGIATPVMAQGNMSAMEEKITNMNADYRYLDEEIKQLFMESGVKQQISNRREAIKSKGSFQFEEGNVYLSAVDLLYLADEIDLLESTYKCNLIDALSSIGTYFKSDGTITYDSTQHEVTTKELKSRLSMANIIQGIQVSQSVKFLEQMQATDKAGNPLYFLNETAGENMDYLENSTVNNGLPMFYKEAYADNLSAGTAAWVNGVLLKGNGEDNKRSRQEGYNEGYTKGVADALGKANIVYTYHKHTGNSHNVGGCYGTLTGVKYRECGCTSYAYKDDYPGYEGIPGCAYCFHNHPGVVCTAKEAAGVENYIGLVCNKTEQTIESATIVY